jgi:telomere length regulation protein
MNGMDESDITDADSSHSFVEYKHETQPYILDKEIIDGNLQATNNRLGSLLDVKSGFKPTDLLTLLSGNQNSSKPCKKTSYMNQTVDSTDDDIETGIDSSFTELKSDECRKEHDLIQLEKKFFVLAKSVSSKDIFARFKKDKVNPTPTTNPISIQISDDEEDGMQSLESRIFGPKVKRTNVRNLLRPAKRRQLLVTLKLNSDFLREIKLQDNPFKVKGNTTGVSSGPSIFKTMMNSQANNAVKKTPLQKLKELEPPTLSLYQFHIYEDNLPHSNDFISTMHKRTPRTYDISGLFTFIPNNEILSARHSISHDSHKELISLIYQTIPDLDTFPPFASIVERFIKIKKPCTSSLWINLFQPECTQDLLMDQHNVSVIKNWIKNSFARLQTSNLKEPRNILLQKRKKKNQRKYVMDGFVVDDSFDIVESSDTEEDIFMPILLIQGSTGSCKSTAVYATMKEDNGYIHEINTGAQRGRKDIYNSLKEFCTTQLVHKQSESKKFQKGLVLLEDVNILFEQDKSFWQVVLDILNISRRPIVLTCEDFIGIPRSILDHAEEELAIIHLDQRRVSKQRICDYLWLCAISQGFNMDRILILELVNSSYNGHNYDLRKCLMECQIICQAYNKPIDGQITYISKIVPELPKKIDDLSTYLDQLDLLSCADIINSNSVSLLNHETIANELYDIYMIDESTQLRQPSLPYELNIGKEISKSINEKSLIEIFQPKPIFTFNQLKNSTIEFLSSRSKKLPKFMQDVHPSRRSTRSQTPQDDFSVELFRAWTSEVVGTPDNSFMHYLTPTPFVLELLPHAGYWYSYQLFLDRLEEKSSKEGLEFHKPVVYRDFQKRSTEISRYIPFKV